MAKPLAKTGGNSNDKDDHFGLIYVRGSWLLFNLKRCLGFLPKGYRIPGELGEWREVPLKKMPKLLEIKGVSQSKWDERMVGFSDWN